MTCCYHFKKHNFFTTIPFSHPYPISLLSPFFSHVSHSTCSSSVPADLLNKHCVFFAQCFFRHFAHLKFKLKNNKPNNGKLKWNLWWRLCKVVFQFLCYGSFFINNISLSLYISFSFSFTLEFAFALFDGNGNDVMRVNKRVNVFAMEWRMSHLANFYDFVYNDQTYSFSLFLCVMKMSSLLCNLNMIMYSLCHEFTVPNKCCFVFNKLSCMKSSQLKWKILWQHHDLNTIAWRQMYFEVYFEWRITMKNYNLEEKVVDRIE